MATPITHCDPVRPDCVFDPTKWWTHPGVEGPVLKCLTHELLAPGIIYELAYTEDNNGEVIRGLDLTPKKPDNGDMI